MYRSPTTRLFTRQSVFDKRGFTRCFLRTATILHPTSPKLSEPTIVFQSNHLVVVNKPPGWQSVVAGGKDDGTCLLEYLKRVKRVGGGSDRSFLLPLHRLDQPCSGIQIYGKTSKAASRIQSKWQHVQKTYLIVVPESALERLIQSSVALPTKDGDGLSWMELKALMPKRRSRNPLDRHQKPSKRTPSTGKGWSVAMVPWKEDSPLANENSEYKLCRLQWRNVRSATMPTDGVPVVFLVVKTNQGARHMIRAVFACHGSTLVGDLRYGARHPLPDRSVALHARRMVLPADRIKLNLSAREHVAPIPSTWKQCFGVIESDVEQWESS